eukprot:8928799-Lingulodinium_polyedra.AAC.1
MSRRGNLAARNVAANAKRCCHCQNTCKAEKDGTENRVVWSLLSQQETSVRDAITNIHLIGKRVEK